MDFSFEKIIQETIDEYADVEFNDKGELQTDLPLVYQLAFEDRLPSIFKNGYSREWFGTAGGNFYCRGVYTTFNLKSTIRNSFTKAHLYGGAIVKLGLSSYDRYFICNKKIAQQVYGSKYTMEDQLKMLFEKFPEVYKKITRHYLYPTIINTNEHYTSNNVQALLDVLGGMRCGCEKELHRYDIRGFVFHGANDGDVTIIRDPKSIIPLAFSLDGAKTWDKKYFSEKTIQNSAKDYDPLIFLGADAENYVNPQNYRFINGFWVVQRKQDNKFNFMDDKKNILFNEIWFDALSKFDDKGRAMAKIGDLVFYVDKHKYVYEKQNDKYPLVNDDNTPMSINDVLTAIENMG